MSANRDTLLSRAYDAGNFCNAYETENYSKAKLIRRVDQKSPDYRAAFILGFFSSYEIHEMSHPDSYQAALDSEAGQRCVELGFVDAPTPEEIENGNT